MFTETEMNGFMGNLSLALEDMNEANAHPEASFDTFANWDSLAAIGVIVMINTEYGVEVSGTELHKCKTPAQLFTVVKSKLS